MSLNLRPASAGCNHALPGEIKQLVVVAVRVLQHLSRDRTRQVIHGVRVHEDIIRAPPVRNRLHDLLLYARKRPVQGTCQPEETQGVVARLQINVRRAAEA